MTSTRRAYRVDVVREDDAWLARMPEVPGAHTYARSLSALEGSVREVLVLMTGLLDDATESFDLDWHYELGEAGPAVASYRKAREEYDRAVDVLAERARSALAGITRLGPISNRDAARLLGTSFQRVAQVRQTMEKRSPVG